MKMPATRKRIHDHRRTVVARQLRRHEWFVAVPRQIINGFAELLVVSTDLRQRLKTDGIMRPDGTLHPAVDALRKYKQTELGYLAKMAEIRQMEQQGEPDIVEAIAKAVKE
jgi:hypothetical protein